MSEFDELFNSIQKSNIVDIIRDSKIELVTEFDVSHPLKTGEYFYEEESNTLYVGAGLLLEKPIYISAIRHNTNILHIPAPRVKTSHNVFLPKMLHNTVINYIPAPRIKTHINITVPTIIKETKKRVVNKNHVICELTTTIPLVSYDTIITKI